MPDSIDYRLYLQECFENIQNSLTKIEKHLEKQNSSIIDLQKESNNRMVVVEDFRHLEKDYEGMKKNVSDIKTDIEELRIFKKHPTWGLILISVFVIGMALSAYQTIKSIGGSKNNEELIQKVRDIEAYIKIPNAPTRSIHAFPDTSKVKK